jgi:hypothetical protein
MYSFRDSEGEREREREKIKIKLRAKYCSFVLMVLPRNTCQTCKTIKLTKNHRAVFLLDLLASNALTAKCYTTKRGVCSEFPAYFLIARLFCV